MIGDVDFIDGVVYVDVNRQGTKEKLCVINWKGRLLFEILRGLGITLNLSKTRDLIFKFKKEA